MHSDKTNCITSSMAADDDDDRLMMENNPTQKPTNSFDTLLNQLSLSVKELEKVNFQFLQLLEALSSPAPCRPSFQNSVNNQQQPTTCPPS